MGRVKQLSMEAWEEKLLRDEQHYTSSCGSQGSQRDLGYPTDDQALAQYEAEFNAWLDAYEKSFGDEEGKLP